MKVLTSRQLSPLIATAFKVAGLIMILAAIVDMAVLPFPFQFQDREWLLAFITQVVDRGIIPLLGIVLILTGYWVDTLAGATPVGGRSPRSVPFWVLVLSSILALVYLLLIVLHVNNVLALKQDRLDQLAEQIAQAEEQVETRIDTEVGQRRTLINELLANQALRSQAVEQGLISAEDLAVLEEFEDDPAKLDTYLQSLEDQAQGIREEQQTQIGVRREEGVNRANREAVKSGMRIGLSSLLLAMGYGIIGWFGLRVLGRDGTGIR
ncbi:MAG: HpsJ family protein [Synechococcales bacterium]|nr:HpsJ family protein [Synechococcales bacterium]